MIDKNTYEKIINSSEFIRWFGNWKKPDRNTSKIVDKNGKPLIVYHGSPYKFNEFDYGKNTTSGQIGAEYAFWFSNLSVATHFSQCYPKLYYKEQSDVSDRYNEKIEKDKIIYLKKLDDNVWESLLLFIEKEYGKGGYHNFNNWIKTGNWDKILKTLETLLFFVGRKNFDEINPKLSEYVYIDKKYELEIKKELGEIQEKYDSQEGYIYPCFIKATKIEIVNGENVGVGLSRIPESGIHCMIIKNADTGADIADEYVVTDSKRIKIVTSEKKSKNIYENKIITTFKIFEGKISGIPLKKMDKQWFEWWVGSENVINGKIKVFRGTDVKNAGLRTRDFVTMNKEYARKYGPYVEEFDISIKYLNYFSGVKGGDPEQLHSWNVGSKAQPTELIYSGENIDCVNENILNSEYIILQRCQKGNVDDGWNFNSGSGQHGDGVYAFLFGDIKMKEYYTKNGENLHTFKILKKYLIDLSNKNWDYWEAKTYIYNNPQYKAFIFRHKGIGIPSSKEVLITDPSIIEII